MIYITEHHFCEHHVCVDVVFFLHPLGHEANFLNECCAKAPP